MDQLFNSENVSSSTELLYGSDGGQKLVVKLTGTACNIKCQYCFEMAKNIDPPNRMSVEVLEQCLDKIDKPIDLLLHGGEPLMVGLRHMRTLLASVRARKDKVRTVGVQTNGTLLDNQWIDLLFREFEDLQIRISISLDGDADINRLRVTRDGRPTHDRVVESFRLLDRVGIKAGMLSVIGRHALDREQAYVEMLNSIPNLAFVKINPLYDCDPGQLRPDSITPSEFTRFLRGVATEWIKSNGYRRFPLEPIWSAIQVVQGIPSRFCNFNNRKCFRYTTVYPDGALGPCDNFDASAFPVIVPDDLGFDEGMHALVSSPVAAPIAAMMDRCEDCSIRNLCGGGCLSQRYYFRSMVPELEDDYCRHRRDLFMMFDELLSENHTHATEGT